MKFCKHCGTQLKDDAKFCPKCGTPQPGVSVAPNSQPTPRTYVPESKPVPVATSGGGMNNAIMALVAVVVVFVGGACFWMYQQSNKSATTTKPIATTQQVSQKSVTQQQAQPASKAAPAPAPAAQASNENPVSGNTGLITGVDVRIRAGAGTDTAILGYFDKGERVAILQTVEGWYKVRRYNGSVGWVSSDFCAR
jgi:hypothetical protein